MPSTLSFQHQKNERVEHEGTRNETRRNQSEISRSEQPFRKRVGTLPLLVRLILFTGGENMRKLAFAVAGLAAIALAAPTIASAQSIGVHIGSDRDTYRDRDYRDSRDFRGSRAEFYRHDRGLHRGWYKDRGDRTVVIKKQRRHWDD